MSYLVGQVAPPSSEETTQDLQDVQAVLAKHDANTLSETAFHFFGRAFLVSIGVLILTKEDDFARVFKNSLAGSAAVEAFAVGWYALKQSGKGRK